MQKNNKLIKIYADTNFNFLTVKYLFEGSILCIKPLTILIIALFLFL